MQANAVHGTAITNICQDEQIPILHPWWIIMKVTDPFLWTLFSHCGPPLSFPDERWNHQFHRSRIGNHTQCNTKTSHQSCTNKENEINMFINLFTADDIYIYMCGPVQVTSQGMVPAHGTNLVVSQKGCLPDVLFHCPRSLLSRSGHHDWSPKTTNS